MKNLFLLPLLVLFAFLSSNLIAQPLLFSFPGNPCINQTFSVNVTSAPPGSASFSWTLLSPGFISVVSPSTALVTLTACGSHTISCAALNASGNIITATFLSGNVICPGLTITPATQTICAGGTATLTVSGASSYTWSNTQNSAVLTPVPLSTTSYSVIGDNPNGCGATAVVNVTSLSIIATANAICAGGSASLAAFGGSGYSWTGSTFTNAVVQNSIAVPPGTYTVSSAGTYSVCTKTVTIATILPPSLTTSMSVSQGTTCIEMNYPYKLSKPIVLSAFGASTYTWFPYNPLIPPGPTITVRPNASTCYSVYAYFPNTGCTSSAVACVTVIPQFTFNVSPLTATVCSGDSVKLSIVNVQQPLAVGPPTLFTYNWFEPPTAPPPSLTSQNSQTVMAFPQITSTYTVEVSDASSCMSLPVLFTVNVTTCVTLGIKSNGGGRFAMYPNPVKDVLFILAPNETMNDGWIELTDLYGQNVSVAKPDFNNSENAYQLDLKELKSGIYLISLYSQGRIIFRQKLVRE